MEKKTILCDACGKVIAGGTWEDAPGVVHIFFGPPEQDYVGKKMDHVCYSCRSAIKSTMHACLERLAKP